MAALDLTALRLLRSATRLRQPAGGAPTHARRPAAGGRLRVLCAALIVALLGEAGAARAGQVRLAWLPVPQAAGYRVYVRAASEPYHLAADLGRTTADPDGIERFVLDGVALEETNYFALTSYAADDSESPLSNELVLTPPLTCAPAPIAGCRAPTSVGGAALAVSNRRGVARDRLEWRWTGAALRPEEFGDPPGQTSYLLCIYDAARGSANLALSFRAQGGAVCGHGRPCWRHVGRSGFTYRHTDPSLVRMKLRQGSAGRTRIRVSVDGAALALPDPPTTSVFAQDPAVRVQFVNDAVPPTCWEATYRSDARVDTAARFKDTSD
jgi:hypothetical protein